MLKMFVFLMWLTAGAGAVLVVAGLWFMAWRVWRRRRMNHRANRGHDGNECDE